VNNTDFNTLIIQLTSIREEVEERRKRLQRLQSEIDQMAAGDFKVSDSVSCGRKGKKPLRIVKITGFPLPYYEQRMNLLDRRIRNLADKEQELLEVVTNLEEKIDSIEDSRIRRILTLRYIDGLSWVQVAHKMGGKATADSCRVACSNFLKNL